jgi:ATPase subunit of ABC transporter with duplicated ATPase domains
MLQVQGLSVEVGGRLIVDGTSFTVMPRDKVGLVGRNGAGKTSLFKVLGGAAEATGGKVVRKGGFGYLPQDPRIAGVLDTRMAVTHVLSGRQIDEQLDRIEKLRVAMEADPNERAVARYSRAQDEFASSGGYAAESEARSIMANGLGLAPDRMELPIGVLSGGERRRVELSRILFAGSDVLLLDEPTNHLDIDAKNWLLGFMRNYRGALLVISHDLELLDEAITRVLHLDRPGEENLGNLVEYKGTYTQYKTARAADESASPSRRRCRPRRSPACRRSSIASAPRPRRPMAHSKEKQIARLEAQRVHVGAGDRTLRMKFPDPPSCGATVITARGMSKGYGGPPVFEDVNFDLGRGERLLVLGLNGAGKTSLLRILAGETTANLGDFEFGHQVTMGYYAQEHDNLRTDQTLLDNLRADVPPGRHLHRDPAACLPRHDGPQRGEGVPGERHASGGEKTKLALAMLMVGRNNLLLLDEPTNNLDPPSRQAVADALTGWKGSIVFVSHDTEFVEALSPTKVLLMPDGQVDYFNEDWLELVSLA